MNHLLGASIASGRVAVGVAAAGIKCRPYLESPLRRIVQARSFVTYYDKASDVPKKITSYKVCDIPVGEKAKNYPQFMKPHRDTDTESWFGSVFTGEVERRYLDYLGKLDWVPFENHVTHFPRRHRSKDEKWLIFKKWAAHIGRKYPSLELMKMRFVHFKRWLANIDQLNSFGEGKVKLDDKKSDIECYPFTCYVPCICHYWLDKGDPKSYHSFTPPDYCELAGSYEDEKIDFYKKTSWAGRDGNVYALCCDNKVYQVFISYDGCL